MDQTAQGSVSSVGLSRSSDTPASPPVDGEAPPPGAPDPEESGDPYRALFDHMSEGFFVAEMIWDEEGRPVDYRHLAANAALERVTGLKPEDLVGRARSEILATPSPCLETFAEVVRTGEPVRFECYSPGLDRHLAVVAYRPRRGRFACLVQDVAERRRAEQEQRESEEQRKIAEAVAVERQRLYEMLDTLPAMVCLITPGHRVAFANASMRALFGEAQGRRCHEAFYGLAEPCEFCQAFRVLETGKPHRWEVAGPHGEVLDVFNVPFTDVDGSPMILEMDLDVTEQRAAQAELERHRELLAARVEERTAELQALMDAAPGAVWIAHDPECRRITGNRVGAELLRSAPGANLSVTAPPGEAPHYTLWYNGMPVPNEQLPMQVAAARGVEVRDSEVEVHFPDGGISYLLGNVFPLLDAAGRPRGAVGTFIDVTARRGRERQIEHLNMRLQRAMAETHHRVKNNLQVIAGLVDLQQMRATPTVPMDEVVRIGRHVRALASVHDVLTAEVQEHPEAETVSARAMLGRLLPLLQNIVGGRSLVYRVTDAPLTVRQCSAVAVLVNECISNAVKHGSTTVEVAFEPADGTARLCVADDGPGFPPGFDIQKDAHTGLALVRSVGEWDLRGQVVCANRPEGGAVVEVTFPLDP